MKQLFARILLCTCLYSPFMSSAQSLWHEVGAKNIPVKSKNIPVQRYRIFSANEPVLRQQLFALPNNKDNGGTIALPMADGTIHNFKVWQSSMMPEQLAIKYPELRTFTAIGVDDPNLTAKLDMTLYGFHAAIFDGMNVSFVDPVKTSGGYYLVHYKKDEVRQWKNGSGEWEQRTMSNCSTIHAEPVTTDEPLNIEKKEAHRTGNGQQLRAYRLALSCNHQYANAVTGIVNPTIAQVLSKMTTTMNRINGIYERELSVTMTFVANEDTLIWTADTSAINGVDPFSAINDNAGPCLYTNQTVCNTRIGNANYDVGHLFTTGAGGLSLIGVICQGPLKAQSVTGQPNPVGDGFDLDYVAHEMGHEFGADHSFNNGGNGSCAGGSIDTFGAFEPGSGSTIMAYAGICGPDDVQPHSDAYFHANSLMQIYKYITTGGDGCALKTPTNNKLLSIAGFNASYTIPYLTPFELIAPTAVDSVVDTSTTYCWEQWNLGDAGAKFVNTHLRGPIFRSLIPVKSSTRVFPKNSMVLAGALSDAGTENAQGEKVPDVARFLTFRLTVRNIFQGNGCFLIPDDTVHLDVINTGVGFTVTSQNATGNVFLGGTPQIITWDVASTNLPPINTPNVDIYMSADGGQTWGYHIGTFINNGSASALLPNPDTTIHAARIKVKGTDNVFFNVNASDFTVQHNAITDTNLQIYPIPTHSRLRVYSGTRGSMQIVICNAVGQRMWNGEVNGQLDIDVSHWARGVYVMKLVDTKKQRTIKKFVVD
jgi:Metallo-peptidase family M12/Secretion system C-terminal sorting domain